MTECSLKWSGIDSLGIWNDIVAEATIERERNGKRYEGTIHIKGFGGYKISVEAKHIREAAKKIQNKIHEITNIRINEIYERRYMFNDLVDAE
ncbi:MAG: hypothetical protein P1Q69_10510 [Candidatus Thorarchaeota archaeon]|nr:hypothetical protein [Candidatus Thorarchaeota archaeon]